MITIDALGKDGSNILNDLDGASPTGGPGGTAWRNRLQLAPGDVVRDRGAWSVVVEAHHFGMTGITVIVLMDAAGEIVSRTLVSCDGAEVRTDARIDSDTLWRLAELRRMGNGLPVPDGTSPECARAGYCPPLNTCACA